MRCSFATTQWTLINYALDAKSERGMRAFERLCKDYWKPVYVFTRKTGASHEDAEDLTQSFFQHMLEKELPDNLAPSKGKFRSWILAFLKNFLASQHRHQTRLKRGGAERATVTLEDAHEEMVNADLPSQYYEREWARSVLANALESLRVESERAGILDRFTILKDNLFDMGKGEGASHLQASALGISLNAAKITLSRLRRRYSELVRKEVCRLVDDPTQVDEEIAHLARVLSSASFQR